MEAIAAADDLVPSRFREEQVSEPVRGEKTSISGENKHNKMGRISTDGQSSRWVTNACDSL